MLPRPIVRGDVEEIDSDVKLLLVLAEPLFQSRNPAVGLEFFAFYSDNETYSLGRWFWL
jgi:hypothetical protein